MVMDISGKSAPSSALEDMKLLLLTNDWRKEQINVNGFVLGIA